MADLSLAQLQAIKAEIDGDPALAAYPNNGDGNFEIAKALNLAADPAFVVWKSNVTESEILRNGMEWTRVDNLSVGKARIWEWMFKFGSVDASRANIRAGIEAVWTGTQADLNVRAAVYVHCKRSASRVEKLLATGTGSDASPAAMGFEGPISHNQIEAARAS